MIQLEAHMSLSIGQKAPDFILPNHQDGHTRLSSYKGQNVVLAFFPLAWTPV
jgi:peroxiredoxin